MEFSLPSDKQAKILKNLIESCEGDVFRLALVLNIVPETLSLDWTPPEGHTYAEQDVNGLLYELKRLKVLKMRLEALPGEES